jgi:hypothetical protein
MRMDIEISPGARAWRLAAPSRDDWGLAAGVLARCDDRMIRKRLCSTSHPATVRGERRFIKERMRGVLWRHSSVNLVVPRPSHRPRHSFPGIAPEIETRVSIADQCSQPSQPQKLAAPGAEAAPLRRNFLLTIFA